MIAFLLFILLQVADGWTTITALNMNGRELNPWLNYLFRKFGVVQTLLVSKLLSITIVGMLVYDHWAVWFLVVVYTFVVANNLKQIKG